MPHTNDSCGSGASIGSFSKPRGIAKGLLVLTAIDFGIQVNDLIGVYNDRKDIKYQIGLLGKAYFYLVKYYSSEDGLNLDLPSNEDLSDILNVIFQGESNSNSNRLKNLITGLTIYNTYNNDEESAKKLAYYKFMLSIFNAPLKDNSNKPIEGNNN